MKLIANLISGLFHPLLMVTYGVFIALGFTYLAVYPTTVKLFLLVGIFLTTAVLPGILVFAMVRMKTVSDFKLTDRKGRVIPYLLFITSILFSLFCLYRMMMPMWFLSLILGFCVAFVITLLINFCWKISAHAVGIGTLLGAVMGLARIHFANPYLLFIILILIAGSIGTARIFLQRNTPMQVYGGFSLGFICTFASAFLSYVYLFI